MQFGSDKVLHKGHMWLNMYVFTNNDYEQCVNHIVNMKSPTLLTLDSCITISTGALVPIDLIHAGALVLTGGRRTLIDIWK